MELRAAVLALALLSPAGSQATTAAKGATRQLPQLEEAINVIEEVAQVTRRTGQWLQASELGQKLQSQARDLSDQLELEVSPEPRQALRQAINSAMQLVDLALWAMEPYLEAAME
ncbi:hypothetical protein Y1Q_0020800 [Alligator mississippiensis]|uniref:Uncharacterized protein n=1 Tax=Alligator mississippiensis TaxID=8496 RepID=A0A151PC81_ALLMI|nr:hypothetical protein Y1Q_0020800 [Alligator mississippiensis]